VTQQESQAFAIFDRLERVFNSCGNSLKAGLEDPKDVTANGFKLAFL